jgi:hypothetical protein
MPTALTRTVVFLFVCITLSACSGRGLGTPVAQECSEGLHLANQELEDAKVNGFGGSIQWIKAANLLAGASFQQQLEHFESCTDKVRRARLYIKEAQK